MLAIVYTELRLPTNDSEHWSEFIYALSRNAFLYKGQITLEFYKQYTY